MEKAAAGELEGRGAADAARGPRHDGGAGGVATTVCTVSGSATSCTGAGPIALPANTTFSVQSVPNPQGGPATADLLFGFRLTTP